MTTNRWTQWVAAGIFVFSASVVSAADWGTLISHGLTGQQGSWTLRRPDGSYTKNFTIDIGAGCNSLTIETGTDGDGGYGNSDLYVRYGAPPSASTYNWRSRRYNYKERIFVSRPPAGRYYIRLYARSNCRTCLQAYIHKLGVDDHGLFQKRRCNWERDIRGIPHLDLDSSVEQASYAHALDMLRYGYYSHIGRTAATRTVAQRVARTGYPVRAARENIGRSYTSSNKQIDAWMRNSTARANILNPNMRHFGFSADTKGSAIRMVAVFAQPL